VVGAWFPVEEEEEDDDEEEDDEDEEEADEVVVVAEISPCVSFSSVIVELLLFSARKPVLLLLPNPTATVDKYRTPAAEPDTSVAGEAIYFFKYSIL
jgi:hypothetical protein